ncbi:hypothetical protein P154DRAFT_414160, partial [Amniculicola lignicola CBS 123094]
TQLPFLGKPFIGQDSCATYFRLLEETLEMQIPADAFPDSIEGAGGKMGMGMGTGTGTGIVSVVSRGTFTSKKTGKSWNEEFIYRFSRFDDEGRIGCWEIWADALSAWDAVSG